MSTEQLFTWAMIQLTLVLLLASTRLRPVNNDRQTLGYFQCALGFDALSWIFYLWPQHFYWLWAANGAASLNIWLLLLYAFNRVGKSLPWLWVLPIALLQTVLYTSFSELASLHLMTVATALVALPSAWLFIYVKPFPSVSDKLYALVMLCWFMVCLIRSVVVETSPEFFLSGYLVSQLLWPGITTAYAVFAITGYLEETQQRLKDEAMLDPLTCLLNRRGMLERVNKAMQALREDKQSAVILMLDLDHFKRINDQHGHDIGDHVLMKVANTLKRALRADDIIARLGGEEFLVFLPNCHRSQAIAIAEHLCQEVAAIKWQAFGIGLEKQTVSIGGSSINGDSSLTDVMQKADQALYHAKQQGRNSWVFAEESAS